MELFDTHSHLDDPQFDPCRDLVLQRAREAAVVSVIAVGTTAVSSQTCVDLAQRYACLYAAVGIQPNYAAEQTAADWDRIVQLASQPRVVALGESGLDRYWDFTPFDMQQDYFDRHLSLAQQTGLPLVIHMRDCLSELLPMLRAARRRAPLRRDALVHGRQRRSRRVRRSGAAYQLRRNGNLQEIVGPAPVALSVPDDRILVETDAPYLSPEPRRETRPNEPALLVHTAQCLADLRGVTLEQFAERTTRNARQLFRLSDEIDA